MVLKKTVHPVILPENLVESFILQQVHQNIQNFIFEILVVLLNNADLADEGTGHYTCRQHFDDFLGGAGILVRDLKEALNEVENVLLDLSDLQFQVMVKEDVELRIDCTLDFLPVYL